MTSPAPAGRIAVRRPQRKFYVGLAVLMTLLVGAGFWPSYFGPLFRGVTDRPWYMHFHGAVYMGWMALLIVQTTLAARGRIQTHRSLGSVGIGYGAFIWVLGIIISFVATANHVTAGEWTIDQAATFLPIPLGDMVLFGSFFGAAVAYRGKSEIHKRLMLLATTAIFFAAAFRLGAAGMPTPLAISLWFVPVILGMAYDLRTQKRVHPVYWIGLVAMGIALLRLPFGESETWLRMGRPLMESIT